MANKKIFGIQWNKQHRIFIISLGNKSIRLLLELFNNLYINNHWDIYDLDSFTK
jgi:hypothetical protein